MHVVCPSCDETPAAAAVAGSACRACGAALVRLELVDLGERTGTPPPKPLAPAPVIEPAEPLTVQAPVVETKLELDADWQREKAARQEAAASPAAQRAGRAAAAQSAPAAGTPWLVIIVVLAGLGAGGYYLMTRKTTSAPADPGRDRSAPATTVPKRGVTIRIVGAPGTPVTIDGAAAGKTPISLQRGSGTRPLVIKAGQTTFQVVPDRDQTVDITAPP